jgi:hypothetical protein
MYELGSTMCDFKKTEMCKCANDTMRDFIVKVHSHCREDSFFSPYLCIPPIDFYLNCTLVPDF